MATRKRVRAFCNAPPRRAPDGSAFTKCDYCGVSVALALFDMHECNLKKAKNKDDDKQMKRFKGDSKPSIQKIDFDYEQPRSSFMFFMESYSKTSKCKSKTLVEINREAFEKWKNMPYVERLPYIQQAQKVDKAYMKLLHNEEIRLSQEKDDEADSAKFAKDTQIYGSCYDSEDDCDDFW